jgi:hypothetical protein
MLVEILRPIPSGGATLRAGEIVDASTWANLRTLLDQGYVCVVDLDTRTFAELPDTLDTLDTSTLVDAPPLDTLDTLDTPPPQQPAARPAAPQRTRKPKARR